MRRRRKPKDLPLTYHSLEAEPDYEHPVDRLVRTRVGRRDLQRVVADRSTAIVKALRRRRRLWFEFERAADELRARREAAYFDVGIEQGIAACAVHGLGHASKTVRALAHRIVHELLATNASHADALAAAVAAAWALLPRPRQRRDGDAHRA